jgi:hypothetical protein
MGIDELLARHPAPWKYAHRALSKNRSCFKDADGGTVGETVAFATRPGSYFEPMRYIMGGDELASLINAYASMKAERDALAEAVKAADDFSALPIISRDDTGRLMAALMRYRAARAKVKP